MYLKRRPNLIDKYFDYNSSTPLDPLVLDKMMEVDYINYNSNTLRGQKLKDYIDSLRNKLAMTINALESEITFTSSATHSNEIAIVGLSNYIQESSQKKSILTSPIEHSSLLLIMQYLEAKGFKIIYVKHTREGRLDYESIERTIEENNDIFLCSIMHVNNEIGIINDIARIGGICRKKGVVFHTDASQSFGKINIDVRAMNIDMLTASGHKIYGPKGIGMLFCSRLPVRVRLKLFTPYSMSMYRGNTLPNELVVGFCTASSIIHSRMNNEALRLREIQLYTHYRIVSSLPDVHLNGPLDDRIFNNLNFSFYGVEGESLMLKMDPFVLSTGSACNSDDLDPSHVISTISTNEDLVHSSLRISFGRWTTKECVDELIEHLMKTIPELRMCSPLY